MGDEEARLLNLAIRRARRALRQEQRLQAAHGAEIAEQLRLDFTSGLVPASVGALHEEFLDELYFLMVAVRHAVKARELLVERGLTLPTISMDKALVAWRDIEEHWDSAERGKPVWARDHWAAAGMRDDPGQGWTFDDRGLTDVSGVSVLRLRTDLTDLVGALGALALERFNAEWWSPDVAAAFMHMDREDLEEQAPYEAAPAMDFENRGGVRYQRSNLKRWRDRLIARGEWPPAE